MPAKARRRYTEEFKKETVRLVRESAHPVAQVARDLGIPENVLYRWRAQHRQAEAHGTTRVAQRAEAEELTRVKRDLARVPQEPDFSKRAAASFTREFQCDATRSGARPSISHSAHVPSLRGIARWWLLCLESTA